MPINSALLRDSHTCRAISSMNGEAVTGLAGLRAALDRLKQDDAVVFQVQRLGRLMFIAFNLE